MVTICLVEGFTPRLASWDRKDHPSQVSLQSYLRDISSRIGTLPDNGRLYLELLVDVEREERMRAGYDIENCLTPLVDYLGASRFMLVSGEKRVGSGSFLSVGQLEKSASFQL